MEMKRPRSARNADGARIGPTPVHERFIGQSPAFQSIVETIKTIAPRECSVVIVGETGTGKEMVAKNIHANSRRPDQVFVPVDCTSLTGQLFESQLFGHVRGAFTGAISDTLGFFRAANGGTIFLDEIGELVPDLQAKLLRVLQESRVLPVGAIESHDIDVRVLCATNHDLRQMVLDGDFRADLYFRLNVVQLEVPPLRVRREDVAVLAYYFLDRQAQLYNEPTKSLSPDTLKILIEYDWPGNVRELANVMEHAYIVSSTGVIGPDSLPTEVLTGSLVLQDDNTFPSLDKVNEKLVIRALQAVNGRKMAAARLLKIDHRKLSRLIRKFNLQPTWKQA